MLDTTGAFHWCPNQTLEKCTLDDEQVVKNNFTLSHLEFLSVTIDGEQVGNRNSTLSHLEPQCTHLEFQRFIFGHP